MELLSFEARRLFGLLNSNTTPWNTKTTTKLELLRMNRTKPSEFIVNIKADYAKNCRNYHGNLITHVNWNRVSLSKTELKLTRHFAKKGLI